MGAALDRIQWPFPWATLRTLPVYLSFPGGPNSCLILHRHDEDKTMFAGLIYLLTLHRQGQRQVIVLDLQFTGIPKKWRAAMELHGTNHPQGLNEHGREAYKPSDLVRIGLDPSGWWGGWRLWLTDYYFSPYCDWQEWLKGEGVSSLSDFKGLVHHGREVMKTRAWGSCIHT